MSSEVFGFGIKSQKFGLPRGLVDCTGYRSEIRNLARYRNFRDRICDFRYSEVLRVRVRTESKHIYEKMEFRCVQKARIGTYVE